VCGGSARLKTTKTDLGCGGTRNRIGGQLLNTSVLLSLPWQVTWPRKRTSPLQSPAPAFFAPPNRRTLVPAPPKSSPQRFPLMCAVLCTFATPSLFAANVSLQKGPFHDLLLWQRWLGCAVANREPPLAKTRVARRKGKIVQRIHVIPWLKSIIDSPRQFSLGREFGEALAELTFVHFAGAGGKWAFGPGQIFWGMEKTWQVSLRFSFPFCRRFFACNNLASDDPPRKPKPTQAV